MTERSLSFVLIRLAALIVVLVAIQDGLAIVGWNVLALQSSDGTAVSPLTVVPTFTLIIGRLGLAWYLWRGAGGIPDFADRSTESAAAKGIETTLIQLVGIFAALGGFTILQDVIAYGFLQTVAERMSAIDGTPARGPLLLMTLEFWVERAGITVRGLTALGFGLYFVFRAPTVLRSLRRIAASTAAVDKGIQSDSTSCE